MIRIGQGLSPYRCPDCGVVEERCGRFIPTPESDRLYTGQEIRLPETCRKCGSVMTWAPVSSQTDLLKQDFVINIDGTDRRVSSLTELRAIERDSLRKAANGEGAPHVFRGFSQDRSNRDVNTLKGSSFETNRQVPIDRNPRVTQSGMPISVRARGKHPQDQ